MSRKKPERWSIRFELAPERDGDVSLHAHLLKLAGEGEASQWIRDTLIASLDKRLIPTTDKPLINGESAVMPKKLPDKVTVRHKDVEVKIEPKHSVQGSTPDELLKQRRAIAAAKFATPVSKPKETP